VHIDTTIINNTSVQLYSQFFFSHFYKSPRDALSSGSNANTIRVLDKFNYKFNVDYDDDDIKVIQYATALVSYRAALLVSICTAVLLNRMNEKEITIAVDGSVYKHHPRLKKWMKQLIKKLAPEKEVSV
jgi:hexokinase